MSFVSKIQKKRIERLKKKKSKEYAAAKLRHQVQREKKAISTARSIARPVRAKGKGSGKSFGSVMKAIGTEAAKWAPPEAKKKKKKTYYEPPPVSFGGGRV
jgi:ribosomal protein L9